MIKSSLTCVICLTCLLITSGLAEEEQSPAGAPSKHYVVNLSLWYPVSLNKSPNDTASVNLTLFYSRLNRVEGLDLALGVTALGESMQGLQVAGVGAVAGKFSRGIQIAGLMNVAGETFQGLQIGGLMNVSGETLQGGQIAGLMNVIGESGAGLQLGGLMNVAGTKLRGWQTAGLFNVVGEDFEGVQITGGFNVAGTRGAGLQAAGLFSVAGEDFEGVQVSGLLNVAGERFEGLQVGSFNVAVDNRGAQLGLANGSQIMRGFQLGLVNWNEETEGWPVGLVNVSKKDGFVRYTVWAGTTSSAANAGVKFEVDRIYSIVGLGYWNLYKDTGSALAYSGFYGVHIYRGPVTVGLDIGYSYLDRASLLRSRIEEPDHQLISFRTLLSRPISGGVSLVGGAGLAYIAERHCSFGDGEFKPLVFLGIEVD